MKEIEHTCGKPDVLIYGDSLYQFSGKAIKRMYETDRREVEKGIKDMPDVLRSILLKKWDEHNLR